MSKRTIVLTVDDLDYEAIKQAVTERLSWGVLPDHAGDLIGAAIAEIARGWIENVRIVKSKKTRNRKGSR